MSKTFLRLFVSQTGFFFMLLAALADMPVEVSYINLGIGCVLLYVAFFQLSD